jgi:hypothetical protein
MKGENKPEMLKRGRHCYPRNVTYAAWSMLLLPRLTLVMVRDFWERLSSTHGITPMVIRCRKTLFPIGMSLGVLLKYEIGVYPTKHRHHPAKHHKTVCPLYVANSVQQISDASLCISTACKGVLKSCLPTRQNTRRTD